MAKIQYPITNLTGGEVTPRLDGRPDVTKQRAGLKVCENFQVVPHGGIRKRSGTQFVCELSGTDHVLQPFAFSTSDSYMLIFGPNTIWIAKDRGLVTETADTITGITKANPGVVTAAAHGFTNGDLVLLSGIGGMHELNNRIVTVASATANTFATGIDTSGYTTFTSGGSAAKLIQVTTTYAADELQELRFAQYNDVMYITHQSHPLRKLSRVSNTSWTLETVEITTGPFRTINGDDEKVMDVAARAATVTGATQANPCVVTVSGTNFFEVGDTVAFDAVGGMIELNGNAYDVTAVAGQTITISVNATGFTAYTSGGSVANSLTLWETLEVGSKVVLTADWGPFVSGHVGSLWRLSEGGGGTGVAGAPLGDATVQSADGFVYTSGGNVYGQSDSSPASVYWNRINRVPDHETGAVRVTGAPVSSDPHSFTANFLHPTYCIVQITSVVSTTEAYATIVRYQMPASIMEVGTSFWEEGAWSEYRGYPRCCAFFEQRLFVAGSTAEPTVVWGSRSSAFENFEDGAEDDDAIIYRAASGYADVIRWLSGGRALVAGTSQGEYAIAASNQNEALTPSNLRMLLQTTYGTSDCPPVRINDAVIYPQRNGVPSNPSRKLREFTYDFSGDKFNAVDITVFAEHITGQGIVRLAHTNQPESMIWSVREDGQLPVCTYEPTQEVIAWQRHVLGGTDAEVVAVAVCSGAGGDEVWTVVDRTISGATRRYLEVFHPPFEPHIHAKEDAKILDAMLTYEGASTATITGLWHLRGEAVKVLNNGSVEEQTVANNGTLTLTSATTKAHIGLPYTAIAETHDIEAGAQAGTAQSRTKRISEVWLRVLGSLGGTCGPTSDKQDDLLYRNVDTPLGSSPPIYSGLVRVEFRGAYDTEARVRIEHDEPVPFFVTSQVVELSTQG